MDVPRGDEQHRRAPKACPWCHGVRRYAAPLLLCAVGYGLWRVPMPGAAPTLPGFAPRSLAFDAGGSLHVSDVENHCVWRIASDGRATRVAGRGEPGFAGDGGPAREALLNRPAGIAFDAAGRLLICDSGNFCVRRVDHQGRIDTVAGAVRQRGKPLASGEGIPADRAALGGVTAVSPVPGGGFLIAAGRTIHEVDAAGLLWTRMDPGARVQGMAATRPALTRPNDLAVGADGSLYIADSWARRVLLRRPSGAAEVFAGTGWHGATGDGGPADRAELGDVWGLATGPDGSVYIADLWRARRVDSRGTITTVAGGGRGGDGVPAARAALDWATDVAVGADGTLYVAESRGRRIRKVDRNGIITTVVACSRVRR